MNKIDPKRAGIFFGIFLVIAFIEDAALNLARDSFRIRSPQLVHSRAQPTEREPQEQTRPATMVNAGNPERQPTVETPAQRREREELEARKIAEAAAKRAAEEAAQHARFLARYLNSGFEKSPGKKSVAITVVTENGKWNFAVGTALAKRFKTDSVQFIPSLFKPEFISDGLFNATFSDANLTFKRLDLANVVDALLFARQTVNYSPNPSLENVITANMEFELAVFPADSAAPPQSWNLIAVGAGFTQAAARALAEERLIKQIASDERLSLTPVLTSTGTQ